MKILLIILGILILGGGITWICIKRESKRVIGITGVLLGLALFVLGCSIVIIPTGKVGAVYQFGILQEQKGIISSGTVYWHIPFIQSVKQINIMQENSNEAESVDARIWGESKDKLPVYCRDVRITYQIYSNGVNYLLKNVADLDELKTWGKTVQSAFTAATILFDDSDVCKQSLIEPVMLEEMQRLTDAKYGKAEDGRSNVLIVRVLIGELDYEQAYQDAITVRKNSEQIAQQQAIENKMNIDRAEAEGEANRIRAEGDAKAKKISADAAAYEIVAKAEAQAVANEKLANSLSDRILANDWIVKWNGQVPYVTDNNGNMIDISGLIK